MVESTVTGQTSIMAYATAVLKLESGPVSIKLEKLS
jgi:hypothetical protein